MDKEKQELILKLSMFEQEMNQLQQQLRVVEQGILELSELNLGLDELKGKTGKEILAPIGRGIFAKASLISEELTVDVGSGNLVKKSIPETKELIEEQIKKLKNVQEEFNNNLEKINEEAAKVIEETEKTEKN